MLTKVAAPPSTLREGVEPKAGTRVLHPVFKNSFSEASPPTMRVLHLI